MASIDKVEAPQGLWAEIIGKLRIKHF
jgi:hypothetical protein